MIRQLLFQIDITCQGDRGGSGVIFASDAEMKVPIAGVPILFTEWNYLALQEQYCYSNFGPPVLSYSKISWQMVPKININKINITCLWAIKLRHKKILPKNLCTKSFEYVWTLSVFITILAIFCNAKLYHLKSCALNLGFFNYFWKFCLLRQYVGHFGTHFR